MIDNTVEQIFADVIGLTPEEHKNVLGDKWKYINAINERLVPIITENIKGKLEEQFGHKPSGRILAIMSGRWDNFWKGVVNATG